MAIAPLPPGTELCPEYGTSRGRFVLRRCLRQTPSLFTYAAEDRLRGGRQVALTECAPEALAGRPEGTAQLNPAPEHQATFADALRLFERQGQLLLELQHPAVERVFDRFAQNGTLYHAGCFYPGARTLRGAFADERPRWPQVEALAQQLLDGLAACHAVGLLHGDLGPDNVLLTPGEQGGEAKLVRFSAARLLHRAQQGADGVAHAPPEFFEPADGVQQAATPGSDLYSWGLLLYGLLVGHEASGGVLVGARSRAASLAAGGDDPYQGAARELAERGVPVEWAEVIAQSLRLHQPERPADVAALRASLAVFAELGDPLAEDTPEPEEASPAAAEPRKLECTLASDAIEQLEALNEPVALSFSASADEVRELVQHKAARHIVSLSLRGKYGAPLNHDEARALADGAALQHLTSLSLKMNDVDPDVVRVLARSSLLQRLSSLGLRCDEPVEAGVRALVSGTLLANLASLDLWLRHLGDEAAVALASSPALANLASLTLCSEKLTDEGVRALASSSSLGRVRSLDLSSNYQLTDGAARALASRPASRRLTSLNLGYTELSDEAAVALARSPHLGRLKVLRLDYSQIGDEGARALVRSAALPRLSELHLQMCSISEAARGALEAERRPGLTILF